MNAFTNTNIIRNQIVKQLLIMIFYYFHINDRPFPILGTEFENKIIQKVKMDNCERK